MQKKPQHLGEQIIEDWLIQKDQQAFAFQKLAWKRYRNGYSGLVVAPTGFGKTYSMLFAVLSDYLNRPNSYKKGLKLIWVAPLRSLAKDLQRAMQEAIDGIGLDWQVAVRNGDVDTKTRQKQLRQLPDIMIVTPESLHLLLALKHSPSYFDSLKCIVVDEWHELLGNKRGVLTELAISRLNGLHPKLQIWGISATIGNLDEALEVLTFTKSKTTIVKAKGRKKLKIKSLMPEEVGQLPWAGHMGTRLVKEVIPIIENSQSTLIFTNTRNQAETWYQNILNEAPEFAGRLAIHHGSIDKHLRIWIEEALSTGKLKAVISTSSLDLGVDFKPVDSVIQVGSSKGVARFMQRGGRSGHSPFDTSTIYFLPTHSLELIEAAALKQAVKDQVIEQKEPLALCFDVLVQYLITLAVGPGFYPNELLREIKNTYCFQFLADDEWHWLLRFITQGGDCLQQYEDFHKVTILEDGRYKVTNRRVAMRHRMNIGVIVSDTMVKVRLKRGGYLGMVEEYFVSRMKVGDKFILAGQVLEFLQLKDMTCYVKKSKGKAHAPSYMGGRLPLSSDLSHYLREKLSDALTPGRGETELNFLHPLLTNQAQNSHIPRNDEFLIEQIETEDGHHLFIYPFEGRLVHEVMAALLAYRISQNEKMTFTMAMNDYGFELLSNKKVHLNDQRVAQLFSKNQLIDDVIASVNATEMASRKFRDIAVISGLVVQVLPGKQKNFKSLQSSSRLLFQVLEDYEPSNLLLRQAYNEVIDQQLEKRRLQAAFKRINQSKIIIKEANSFTPLSFPIKVDSLRASMSNESLADRIKAMQRIE